MISTESAIVLGCSISLCLYFFLSVRCHKLNNSPIDFYYADLNISGPHYGSTYAGANITFTSIFMYLCFQATVSGLSTMWASFFWIISVFLFYILSPNLLDSFKKGQTIHQYLGERYNSKKLVLITSGVTIFAFIGTIGLEFYGFSLFLKFFGLSSKSTISIGITLIILMAAYCFVGGYWATIKTDILQVTCTLIGLLSLLNFLGILNFPLGLGIDQAKFETHWRYLIASFRNDSFFSDPFLIIGFFILFIPFQFSVMDMWQRCIATGGNLNRIRKYTLSGGIILGLIFIVPITIGIVASKAGYVNGVSNEVLFICIKQIANPYTISLISIMFLSSVFSTADTLLLAASNSLICDMNQVVNKKALNAYDLNKSKIKMINCQITTIILAFLTIFIFILANFMKISDIIIAVFSAQSIIGILVICGFILKERAKKMNKGAERAAIIALCLPIPLVSIGIFLKSQDIINIAPLLSIMIALPVLLFSKRIE